MLHHAAPLRSAKNRLPCGFPLRESSSKRRPCFCHGLWLQLGSKYRMDRLTYIVRRQAERARPLMLLLKILPGPEDGRQSHPSLAVWNEVLICALLRTHDYLALVYRDGRQPLTLGLNNQCSTSYLNKQQIPSHEFTWNLIGGVPLKRKIVFQDPPVRFHVNWWEIQNKSNKANTGPWHAE